MKTAAIAVLFTTWALVRSRRARRNEWHDARWLAWAGSFTRVL